jgi:hypothetical protein
VLVGPFGRSAIFAADGAADGAAEGARLLVVSEGGRVNAWTVRRIAAGEVQMVGPGGDRIVHPSFPPSPGGPARPAAPGQRIGLSPAR